ncbi:hypothetical protein AB1Y20_013629 [Prymnesium parvum]|uniref:Condensin complex subunit 1 C-terminal domain-containing protein n=1 Tax=Prymnesium parvum TaxID=97485 RepID=A0AB34IHZ9_PRYPA
MLPPKWRPAVEAVPREAMAEWSSGERNGAACEALREAAAVLGAADVRALHTYLRTLVAGGAGGGWARLVEEGVQPERFLVLMMALLCRPALSSAAAACMLTAMRVNGAVTHGVLHAVAFFDLVKALRALLGGKAAAPKRGARKAGKAKRAARGGAEESEEEEEEEGAKEAAGADEPQLLLRELLLLLRSVPLRAYPEPLAQLVELLASVASSHAAGYEALGCCLRSEHGELDVTVSLVFKALLPVVTLATDSSGKAATSSQMDAVEFVAATWRSHGADAPPDARQTMLNAVQALLQHASAACPDRAEPRAHVCAALSALLLKLPAQIGARYVLFLWRLSRTAKVSARTFAVEMAGAALEAAGRTSHSPLHSDGTPQTLWRLLVQHASDKAAGVRAKALTCLASLLALLHAQPERALLALVQQPLHLPPSPSAPATPSPPSGGEPRGEGLRSPAFASPSASLQSAAASMDASLPSLGALLTHRCVDERPAVRRAALGAIEAWALASGQQLSASQLSLLSLRCADTSPAIRKQAARALCALLRHDPQAAALRAAWARGVLPLAHDAEPAVCEACLESVLALLLAPLARAAGAWPRLAWPLLAELRVDTRPLLRHCVRRLALLGRLPSGLAPSLVRLLTHPHADAAAADAEEACRARLAAWGVLAELSALPADGAQPVDAAAVLRAWEEGGGGEAAAALGVLLGLARAAALPAAVRAPLAAQLHRRLAAFDAPAELAVLLVQAAAALGGGGEWAAALMARCEAGLGVAGEAVERKQLFLLVAGELAIAAPHCATDGLVGTMQALVHATDGGEAHDVLSATAMIALGKVCLTDAERTKRLLPVFMKELAAHAQPAVRNNALVALFDLIKRHAAVLDRHVPSIGLAIADDTAFVRRQALMLFTQLLLEDYIKWRPTLLRAFCVALVDSEPSQREAARIALFDMLLPRSPLLGFNSFVGLLFQLNGCTHSPHHPAPLPPAERAVFELPGEAHQRRRLQILRALLSHMTDEQRLQTTAKLCHEVLAALPDGQLDLHAAHWVVSDTLMLLICKEIKLSAAVAGGGEEADEGEAASNPAAAAASAKSKLLSLVARKAMVESIVPIVVELKRHLEQQRSPLLRDIFLFLRELLKDHKTHLQDIFSRDRQLAAEIEYDLRQIAAQHTPRPLQPLTPDGPPSPAATPRGGRQPGSKASRAAFARVPTPDRLKQLSIPRLRRASLDGSGGRPSLPPVPRLPPAEQENRPDVVMASPFKEAPPPRQWNVCASPEKPHAASPALAKRPRGMFDDVA